jgi:hypothetical protein
MANFLSTVGKGVWTAAVVGLAGTSPKNVGWGTGSGQTVASTNLATPAAPTATTATAGTISAVTTTVTNDTVQVTCTLTAGGTLAITEAGTFSNATMAGALCQYGDYSVINLSSGDSIAYTFKTALT